MKKNREKNFPTIYDIAERAGVSPGTVSRTINNIGYIKEETREKIEQVARELEYTPNRAARTLKTKKTGLILLAIPDTDNPFYIDMIKAILEEVKARDHSLVLYYTEGNINDELKALRMMHEHFADGMIFVNLSLTDKHLKEIERIDCPLVLSSISVGEVGGTEDDKFDYVGVDSSKGVYIATKHLIMQGHTKIAYIAGSKDLKVFEERFEGYCNALLDGGLKLDGKMIFWKNYTESSGYEGAQYFLALEDKPTAICCANDMMAVGAMRALDENNIKIPEQISIIGMDNIDMTSRLKPKLSSVSLAQWEIGRAAVDLIFKRLKGKETGISKKIIFQPRLVVKDSSIIYEK
jgi:LacI family transcriptional regulator